VDVLYPLEHPPLFRQDPGASSAAMTIVPLGSGGKRLVVCVCVCVCGVSNVCSWWLLLCLVVWWGWRGIVLGLFVRVYMGLVGVGEKCAHLCTFVLLRSVSSTHGLSFGTPIASILGEAVPNSRRATGWQNPGPRGHYGGPGEIPTFLKRRVRPILKVSGEPPDEVKAIVVFDKSGSR
jgi:hypothetical protein